jgi:hypothetical protein
MTTKFIAALALLMVTVFGAAQPGDDAVGFPKEYAGFTQVRTTTVKRDPSHGTVFANRGASGVPVSYPYGSIIVMEWRRGSGGEIARLDVMRKERGFGASYGADRNGEWAYASYSPDGKLVTGAVEALECAQCHLKAGAAKDFVFGGPIGGQ